MCLLIASLLIGYFCITESYLAAPLLPAKTSAFRWRADMNSDAWIGGKSVMHIKEARERLRFDFELIPGAEHPFAAAELAMIGKNGKPVLVDLSRYSTVSFFVKCAPSNTLQVNIPTFDPKISRRDNVLTYRMPTGYFSCGPSETRVELDLKHLEIPQWWFDMFKLDLSQHAYRLDQVPKIAIGSTHQSPHGTLAGVDIRDVVLEGRDRDYLVALAIILAALWLGFGIWFFRAHARALIADMNAKLKKDLPLVAYQQLSMEPHRDKEKAAILRFIATNYTDANLDLERIVAETGANRNKINDILKAELGFTFSGYLNKLRLTEAARLLAEKGTATVAEIAYSVGYSNVSYFNKLFKEEYGCTPKAFRSVCAQQSA